MARSITTDIFRNYASGESKKKDALRISKEYISKFREAESIFSDLQSLCLAQKVSHDPQITTIIKFESVALGCFVEVIFENKSGLPLCANLIDEN